MTDLFELAEARTLARKTDPATSHAAAQEKIEGVNCKPLSADRAEVFAALQAAVLCERMALTYGEIAAYTNTPAGKVWRRLKELETLGLAKRHAARRCKIGGRTCTTWAATHYSIEVGIREDGTPIDTGNHWPDP